MEIIDKRNEDNFIPFRMVPVGQVFEGMHGDVFLKIKDDGLDPNVFDLTNNKLDYCFSDFKSKRVYAEIVLLKNNL